MIPGRSGNWAIRRYCKEQLPENCQWIVDAFFGILIDGRSPYKLDVNRLIEVWPSLKLIYPFSAPLKIVDITLFKKHSIEPEGLSTLQLPLSMISILQDF